VKVPRPYGYIPDLAGREAFVMERLEGETIGRRIVRKGELEHARFLLPVQMAEELAKIHAIPAARVSRLAEAGLERMVEELGEVDLYLQSYNELTGLDVRPEVLDYWELAGNVGWAIGCLTQMQRHLTGQDRSVELAILGRLGAEVEYEIVHLLEKVAA